MSDTLAQFGMHLTTAEPSAYADLHRRVLSLMKCADLRSYWSLRLNRADTLTLRQEMRDKGMTNLAPDDARWNRMPRVNFCSMNVVWNQPVTCLVER